MKLINSRGRVLLEVTGAHAQGMDARGLYGVTYIYIGDGCGGNVPLEQLHKTIEFIKMDAPSSKLVGLLPEPEVIHVSTT